MTKLNKKYVIGTHVMFFEIEMYKDFIDGLINVLETVENKENVIVDVCFNMGQNLEKIDEDKMKLDKIFKRFLFLEILALRNNRALRNNVNDLHNANDPNNSSSLNLILLHKMNLTSS